MHSAITPLLRFISRNLLSLLVIALILVAGKLALKELAAFQSARADLLTLSRSTGPVVQYAQGAAAAATQRAAALRAAPGDELDRRIAALKGALQSNRLAVAPSLLTFPLPTQADIVDRVVAHYQRQLEIELWRQELAHLEQLRSYLGQKPAQQELHRLHQVHVEAYAKLLANREALQQLSGVQIFRRLVLEQEQAQLLRANLRAYLDYREKQRALALLNRSPVASGFVADQARIDAIVAPLRDARAKAESMVAANWLARLSKPLIDMLPLAASVLLASFAGHFAIKAFFYYVLAPLATRHRPICLDKRDSGRIGPSDASAVSQAVTLAAGEQLLILPDYIQSSPMSSEKRTRWLLDWSCPWTSLISGMYGLTCIRHSGSEPIVVSAGADPLSEVALITLPAGAAMVFQPRCLVGVIYPCATPLRISRQWRLASAHAWLTLQLRYLVFHGPATLIVRGTRGVRVEPAGAGRLISQSATLGFSAGVDYATVRCETFYPFYQGKTALLQDRFDGRRGYYVYDETPRSGKRSNFFERGLEGLSDAALKVFGI